MYCFHGCDVVERWVYIGLHWPTWIYQLGCQHDVPTAGTYLSVGLLDLIQCDIRLYITLELLWFSLTNPNRGLDIWLCNMHSIKCDTLDYFLSSSPLNLCGTSTHIWQSADSGGHCGSTWTKPWALKHDSPLQTLWAVLTWFVVVILLNCYLW